MPSTQTLDALRSDIARRFGEACVEGGAPERRPGRGTRPLTFGVQAVDAAFAAAGLPLGVHQIAGEAGDGACGLLFAILLMARHLASDPLAHGLVVQERALIEEAGGLYGPGLHALGLDPGRLAFVAACDGVEALRMVDEAVRSGAVTVVLAELHRAAPRVDLSLTRRFNLSARETSTLALLTTPNLDGTSAAMTRWRVKAAPSRAPRRFLGPPTLELDLVRNRLGPVGRFTVQWSREDVAFRTPAPFRAPLVRPPAHRPVAEAARPWDGNSPCGGGDAEERLAAVGGR